MAIKCVAPLQPLLCGTKMISTFTILTTLSRYEHTLQKSDFSKLINLFGLKSIMIFWEMYGPFSSHRLLKTQFQFIS